MTCPRGRWAPAYLLHLHGVVAAPYPLNGVQPPPRAPPACGPAVLHPPPTPNRSHRHVTTDGYNSAVCAVLCCALLCVQGVIAVKYRPVPCTYKPWKKAKPSTNPTPGIPAPLGASHDGTSLTWQPNSSTVPQRFESTPAYGRPPYTRRRLLQFPKATMTPPLFHTHIIPLLPPTPHMPHTCPCPTPPHPALPRRRLPARARLARVPGGPPRPAARLHQRLFPLRLPRRVVEHVGAAGIRLVHRRAQQGPRPLRQRQVQCE